MRLHTLQERSWDIAETVKPSGYAQGITTFQPRSISKTLFAPLDSLAFLSHRVRDVPHSTIQDGGRNVSNPHKHCSVAPTTSYILDVHRKETTYFGAGTGQILAADGSTRLRWQSRGIQPVDSAAEERLSTLALVLSVCIILFIPNESDFPRCRVGQLYGLAYQRN
jgi:hypothetical protein